MSDKIIQFHNLIDQWKIDSDRAKVILVAAYLDENLKILLKSKLIESVTPSDDIFENSHGALKTFSSKMNMAYRLGLISEPFLKALKLIKSIRNQFAHDVDGCDFENLSVKSKIANLEHLVHEGYMSTIGNKSEGRPDDILDGVSGKFLFISSTMVFHLQLLVSNTERENEMLTDKLFKANS